MLTTAALLDDDLDRAAAELMDNACRLALAGLADPALEALGLLLSPGAWRLPAHGALAHRLERLLPTMCLLAGQACPAVGRQPAAALGELQDRAAAEMHQQRRSLLRGQRLPRPAGADWSPACLRTLPSRHDPLNPRPHLAFGAFTTDAGVVLQARVAQRFGGSTAMADLPSAEELDALPLQELEALGMDRAQLDALLAQYEAGTRIEVAPEAAAVDTLDIVRAVDRYLRQTGFAGGYLEPVFLPAWLLLVDEGRSSDAVEAAGAWLRQDERAAARLIDFVAWPQVAVFLRNGAMRQTLQLDEQAARAWIACLASRVARPPTRIADEPGADTPAAASRPELQRLLQGTALQDLAWLQVPVLGGDEHAWAAPIPVPDRRRLWQEACTLVVQTGRWPLVTTLWSGAAGDAIDPAQLDNDLFMRFPYEQGPTCDDITPRGLIAGSRAIDVDRFLSRLQGLDDPLDDNDAAQAWKAECHTEAEADSGRQDTFDPDNAWLVLLPTRHSENALAYMHWYGMERGPADGFIALLRRWRERHGAELFAHYGTMLEFVVRQPPADLETALALAREHERAAPCTLALPGIPRGHYALGLVGHGDWFLHERP